MRPLILSLLLLAACSGGDEPVKDKDAVGDQPNVVDIDEDGIAAEADCDDTNPNIGTGNWYYADQDGDGVGDTDAATLACDAPAKHVSVNGDCDDEDADAYPGAAEIWYDGVDQDCQGGDDDDQDGDGTPVDSDCDDTDPGVIDAPAGGWYYDCDGDGLFAGPVLNVCSPADDTTRCFDSAAPDDWTRVAPANTDCDDTASAATIGKTWYYDCDGDGAFAIHTACNPATDTTTCADSAVPDSYQDTLPATLDCDDGDSTLTMQMAWYGDCDGDGAFGNVVTQSCGTPATSTCTDTQAPDGGWSNTPGTDCDDEDATGAIVSAVYPDCDGDGAFSAVSVAACGGTGADAVFQCADNATPDGGWGTTPGTDCDDEDASLSGLADWFADCDGDGVFADRAVSACGTAGADAVTPCTDAATPDGGWATSAGADCNDEDSTGAAATAWYADCDGDTVFGTTRVMACGTVGADAAYTCVDGAVPDGGWDAAPGTDCNDEDAANSALTDWFPDCDADAAYDATGISACGTTAADAMFDCDDGGNPDSWSATAGTDCDDEDAAATSATDWFADCDGDGVFSSTAVSACGLGGADAATACSDAAAPNGGWSTAAGTDCDDEDAAGAAAMDWFPDCDGDGLPSGTAVNACTPDAADLVYDCASGDPDSWFSAAGIDCDDEDASAGAVKTWWYDCDGDSAYQPFPACNPATDTTTCADGAVPDNFTDTDPTAPDCDDTDAGVQVMSNWYADCDADNHADTVPVLACGMAGADALTPCADSQVPDGSWLPTMGDDCDDEDGGYHTPRDWFPDCDSDGQARDLAIFACSPTAADTIWQCADGQTPDGGWGPTAGSDCNDEAPGDVQITSWYPDCDGDGQRTPDPVVDACGMDGASAVYECPSGGDPVQWANSGGTDCNDDDVNVEAVTAWFADCDGDGVFSASAVQACGTDGADLAFDCADGADPDGGWSATAGTDCDDELASAQALSALFPDCDGDGSATGQAVMACGTDDANDRYDCPAGGDPTTWMSAAGTDCDDNDSGLQTVADWFPDCDADAVYAPMPVQACGMAGADAVFNCVDGTNPDSWSANAGTDCDDEDSGLTVATDWFADCDGDGVFDPMPVNACGTAEADAVFECTGGGDPTVWSSSAGSDCNDDDAAASAFGMYYADCDGDGSPTDGAIVACGEAGADAAFDCVDGADPDGGWDTAPGLDCDDEDAGITAIGTWYPDCDNDGAFADLGLLACGTAGADAAFACEGGGSPPAWSNTPGSDCNDELALEQTRVYRYPDCDGDNVTTGVGVFSCGTLEADELYECPGGGDVSAWGTTAGTDCDDTDPNGTVIEDFYPDCDGDGEASAALVGRVCGPLAANALYDCPGGGDPAAWMHSMGTDCNDDDPDGVALEDLWLDCDGDGSPYIAPVNVCGPNGACPDGSDPVSFLTAPPALYDCDDDSGVWRYCRDCADILLADPTSKNGNYMIAGDNTVPPFEVECNMSGGGWTKLLVDVSRSQAMIDGVIMAQNTASDADCTPGNGNPWCKCEDDSAQYYVDYGFTQEGDVVGDVNGTGSHFFDLHYQTPLAALTDAQTAALRAVVNQMAPGNAMVASVSDDGAGDWHTFGASGHEVYLLDDVGTPLLLTDGENGDCGTAGAWPAPGSESGYWGWHTDPRQGFTSGMFDAGNPPLGFRELPKKYILPRQAVLEVHTGGGASFGWEYRTIEVREAPRDCREVQVLEGGLDGPRRVAYDGVTVRDAYCDMHTDGGGWTMLGNISGADSDRWSTYPGMPLDVWGGFTAMGTVTAALTNDYKSPAWNSFEVTDAEIMLERRYDGALQSQIGLDNACLFGVTYFNELFGDVGSYASPCSIDLMRQIYVPPDTDGLKGRAYVEYLGVNGMGQPGTNGFCWTGGDTDTDTFRGHLGYNPVDCYGPDHHGYVTVFEHGGMFSLGDIDQTNWMSGVDTKRSAVTIWAR